MTKWKKVTPLPPEFNGYGYLFECTNCHKVTTYLGAKKLPPWDCECKKTESEGKE